VQALKDTTKVALIEWHVLTPWPEIWHMCQSRQRMTMKTTPKEFRVRDGDQVNLRKWPTNVDLVYRSKEQYHKLLAEHVAQLSAQPQILYASNHYAVQAMTWMGRLAKSIHDHLRTQAVHQSRRA